MATWKMEQANKCPVEGRVSDMVWWETRDGMVASYYRTGMMVQMGSG